MPSPLKCTIQESVHLSQYLPLILCLNSLKIIYAFKHSKLLLHSLYSFRIFVVGLESDSFESGKAIVYKSCPHSTAYYCSYSVQSG